MIKKHFINTLLKKLTFVVVVKGFGKKPMMLISNVRPNDKRLTLVIVKVYLKRYEESKNILDLKNCSLILRILESGFLIA